LKDGKAGFGKGMTGGRMGRRTFSLIQQTPEQTNLLDKRESE
jgi:hypothetical protein